VPALPPLIDPGQALAAADAALSGAAGAHGASAALDQVAQVLPHLRGQAGKRGEALLARPTDGPRDPLNDGYTAPFSAAYTTHFCIFWVTTSNDRIPAGDSNGNGFPDYVDFLAAFAEGSYQVEHGRLGFRKPKSDGARGCSGGDGRSRIDLYLVSLNGLYGYATVDPGQRGRSQYGYMVLDNDMRNLGYADFRPPLSVTMAHEYGHVLQNTYDLFGDKWAKEGAATWLEEQVFPAVNDYLNYLRSWTRVVELPLTTNADVKVYGDAVWNHFLSRRYGVRTIRDVWATTPRVQDFSAGAYDRTIRGASRGRSSFLEDFAKFAASTAEWRVTKLYPDHSRYPDVKRSGSLLASERTYDAFRMDHTTFRLLRVPTSGRLARLELLAPRGTASALALVARNGSRVKTILKLLRNGGRGQVKLPAPRSYDRITAVIVNGDIRQRGYSSRLGDYVYVAENRLYQAGVYGR
jgi:hypothetical protein